MYFKWRKKYLYSDELWKVVVIAQGSNAISSKWNQRRNLQRTSSALSLSEEGRPPGVDVHPETNSVISTIGAQEERMSITVFGIRRF
ncbi:hypothetical protein [Paenibacillus sp. Soil766]|uniref:hypothetical protein n=1 Tax=Paenibacillus sp. Soil766 TaxID=1736404 RepID=UPI0012FBA888|nr:hypothetical protein [Paenibacillus sp. Soil766]